MNETEMTDASKPTAVPEAVTFESLLHAAMNLKEIGLKPAHRMALLGICTSVADGSELVGDGVLKISRADIARCMDKPAKAVDEALDALVAARLLLGAKPLDDDAVECTLNIFRIFSQTPLVRAEKV